MWRSLCKVMKRLEQSLRMLKFQLFPPLYFNDFYDLRAEKNWERPLRAPTALRNFPLATRNFPLTRRNFSISEQKQRPFWAKKEEKALCLWTLSSSLYKGTTFFGKKQILLTYRNTPWNVKKTRFAQAGLCQVLYYEGRMDEHIQISKDRQAVNEWTNPSLQIWNNYRIFAPSQDYRKGESYMKLYLANPIYDTVFKYLMGMNVLPVPYSLLSWRKRW